MLFKNHCPIFENMNNKEGKVKRDESLVGTIDLGSVFQEGSTGRLSFNSIGECSVYVYSDEGPVPHFHIISKNKKFHCCVCIYEPLYFNHGYKTDTLNANQRKLLNNWLKEKHYKAPMTNWEVIDLLWDSNNEENKKYKIQKTSTQPDYTNMENYKTMY